MVCLEGLSETGMSWFPITTQARFKCVPTF